MEITNYTPDVLLCLANLSNDEVFTPPNVANAMLDLLPEELWSDPNATFLDPCCKSGVFLREIAKRLIKGLEEKIPDLETRLDHIFKKQLFGIAITELTALLTRRSLYCSKHANSKWSVAAFDTPEGNIAFPHVDHTWDGMRCKYCGAPWEVYGERKETHAYAFIHTVNPEEIFKMKFDVIIGNPPYQLSDGGGGMGSSASPIYHHFVEQAKNLKPRHLVMIIPSRWFTGGKGLDEFRVSMLNDTKIVEIHDFLDSSICFPGVEIKGGVCYFLRGNTAKEKCNVITHTNVTTMVESLRPLREDGVDIFIRHKLGVDILKKVQASREASFVTLVSSRKPFGLSSTFSDFTDKPINGDDITLYANKKVVFTSRKNIKTNAQWIDLYKVFITFAYGAGEEFPHQILNKPFVAGPNSGCTETYLHIGPFKNKQVAENVKKYIETRFFRFMVMLRKTTQNGTAKVYQLVPMQDFSKPWTDEELYAKYGLTQEEIDFIESMIRPMEVKGNE